MRSEKGRKILAHVYKMEEMDLEDYKPTPAELQVFGWTLPSQREHFTAPINAHLLKHWLIWINQEGNEWNKEQAIEDGQIDADGNLLINVEPRGF